ncbi:MAG: DUF2561 family protein [Mycobacterium sp.]
MASDPADIERTAHDAGSPETVDRLMVGVCGAIWLVLLAISVIATVALVRLGRGPVGDAEKHSSWLLYSIIVVSALIIIGAIPLLMRARRTALTESGPTPDVPAVDAPVRPTEAPTEKLRVFGTAVDPYAPQPQSSAPMPEVPAAAVERLWLRGSVSLLAAMGLALIAVATATYLLATESDTGAWMALGTAAVITVAMPAILVAFQRRLADVIHDTVN